MLARRSKCNGFEHHGAGGMVMRSLYRYRNNAGAAVSGKKVDIGSLYATRLVNIYGASEVWRLTDIATGTAIPATVSSARNGVLSGWTLQNTASPITGETLKAPYLDGVNDFGNIFSASLASIFDPTLSSIALWIKLDPSIAVTFSRIFSLYSASDMYESLAKTYNSITWTATSYRVDPNTLADGTTNKGVWQLLGASFDEPNNLIILYDNGTEYSQPMSETWSGALTAALLGANPPAATPTQNTMCWMAYAMVKFGSVWRKADWDGMLADASGW